MNKTTKIMIVVLVVVAIGAAAFFLWPKKPQNNNQGNAGGNGSAVDENGDTAGSIPSLASNPYVATPAPVQQGTQADLLTGFNQVMQFMGLGSASQTLLNVAAVDKSVFPLHAGSRGDAVKKLQGVLNVLIAGNVIKSDKLVTDGIWGPKTSAAVRQYYPSNTVSYPEFMALYNRISLMTNQ